MRSDPAIRAALDVAGEAVRQTGALAGSCAGLCELPPCHCSRVAAVAAVAAFLRAPRIRSMLLLQMGAHDMAAAVEAEAGGG